MAGAISMGRSVAWLMVAKTVAYVLGFALPLVLVRRLSQSEFGLYKQVFLLVGSAMTVLPLGFVMSAFYFLPRQLDKQARVAANILVFHVTVGAAACLVLLWHPGILGGIFKDPVLGALSGRLAVLVLLMVAFSFIELLALAANDVRAASVFIVLTYSAKTLLLLGAAFWYASIDAVIYAALVHGLLQAALLLWYLHARFPGFSRALDPALMRAQLVYALPLGGAAILSMAQSDLHYYFVAHYFDAATYALYAVGCFQLPLVAIFSESVGAVAIPAMSRLQLENRPREIVELSVRLMRALAAFYFPIYVFLLVAGREFIAVLFTSRYADSWPIFAVNLTLLPLAILTSVSDPVLRAYPTYTSLLLRARLLLLGVLVVTVWLGASHGWLLGAILAVIGVNAADRLLLAVVLSRALGVSWRDAALLKDVGKLSAASIVGGLAAVGTCALLAGARPIVVLAGAAVAFAGVYLGAVVAFGVPTAAERERVRARAGELRRRWGRPRPRVVPPVNAPLDAERMS